MDYRIVNASADHARDIASLTTELGYAVNAEQTAQWLADLLASSFHNVFVAIGGDKVCGWLVVEKRLFLESGSSAEITGLVVGAEFRRNGIADALVSVAESWAKEQYLEKLVVRSNIARKESHIFYPKAGFTHSKTTHVYIKSLA
jgi:GNAT superfamily N-acetyltransferase